MIKGLYHTLRRMNDFERREFLEAMEEDDLITCDGCDKKSGDCINIKSTGEWLCPKCFKEKELEETSP